MKQMFKDSGMQAAFEETGFIKLPWLNSEEVAALIALYTQLTPKTPDGFSVTMAVADSSVRTAVREGILSVYAPKLCATFVDPLPLMCTFMTKTSGDGVAQSVPSHQDWTFVDEMAGDVSINIWCPLEATDDRNGNLCLVPRSNRLRRYERLAEPADNPYKAYYDVLKQASVAVPTSLGEALLFDNATIHFSSRNQTGSLRLVAGAMVVDQSAKQVLYYQNAHDGALVDEYHSGIDYFIQKPFGARPDTFLRTIPKTQVPGVDDEVRRLFPQVTIPQAEPPEVPVPPTRSEPARRSFLGRVARRLFG